MAEIDKVDRPDYEEPTFADVSESMSDRMTGIRKRFDWCQTAERDLRMQALDDFRFAWVAGTQWDSDLISKRGRRPRYEFNKLGQAIKQVINTNRQNTPSIKVRANKESTKDLADIRQGLMRNIEALSHADSVYDWGALFAITSGFGAWEVTADYVDENSFDQDLIIQMIENPLMSVWFGPSKRPDRRDAPYAFMLTEYTWEEYNKLWPDADYRSFNGIAMQNCSTWYNDRTVQVAKYWYKETTTETIYQLEDGRVVNAKEWDAEPKAAKEPTEPQNPADGMEGPEVNEAVAADQPDDPTADPNAPPAQPAAPGQPAQPPAPQLDSLGGPAPVTPPPRPRILKTRKIQKDNVKYEYVSGLEVLDGPYDWKGQWIPLVPCWGNFVNDAGIPHWFGMVRMSKDAQTLYNYNRSNSVEVLANQSRAPFLYTPAMVKGYETQWTNFAVSNSPGLPFEPDSRVNGGMPVRQQPPTFPQGMLEASNVDDADIKATSGIFQASLGQPSNETSGKAIQSRAHQGNIATYDYQDNIAKAVQYTGEIIDDLIPYYYDTYREIRILGPDGAEKYIEVNKPVWNPKTLKWDKINDLSQGKYDVTVTVGPSYATQRMETLDAMLQLAQAGGPTAMLFQYLAVKNMDVPGMQEGEEALRHILVGQGILKPGPDDPPPQPPPPPPVSPKDQAAAMASQAQAQKYQAEVGLTQAKTARTVVETHKMVEEAPADLVSKQNTAELGASDAVNAHVDNAWKQAWLEQHRQVLNGNALVNLDQQTIPYGGG